MIKQINLNTKKPIKKPINKIIQGDNNTKWLNRSLEKNNLLGLRIKYCNIWLALELYWLKG